jgi:hypothetical protein
MPQATITDWANGPMGPGFFLHFPAHRNIWYDGGGMWDYIEHDRTDDGPEREKRIGEIVALILLMRR